MAYTNGDDPASDAEIEGALARHAGQSALSNPPQPSLRRSDSACRSPATGSVLLLLDGYRDVAVSRDARAAKVSDERLKGQNASRGSCDERALAASAVFAFGPQIGKEARRFTGVAGLDIGIATASKQGHDAPLKVADSAAPEAAFCDPSRRRPTPRPLESAHRSGDHTRVRHGSRAMLEKSCPLAPAVGERQLFAHSRHSLRPLVTASSSHG